MGVKLIFDNYVFLFRGSVEGVLGPVRRGVRGPVSGGVRGPGQLRDTAKENKQNLENNIFTLLYKDAE